MARCLLLPDVDSSKIYVLCLFSHYWMPERTPECRAERSAGRLICEFPGGGRRVRAGHGKASVFRIHVLHCVTSGRPAATIKSFLLIRI